MKNKHKTKLLQVHFKYCTSHTVSAGIQQTVFSIRM